MEIDNTPVFTLTLLMLGLSVVGCKKNDREDLPAASTDWNRDIVMTNLIVDLDTMRASADIVLTGSLISTGASFEIGDLAVENVTSNAMQLQFTTEQGRLDVGVPQSHEAQTLTIEYSFGIQDDFSGLLQSGATFTWPYFCGNLFPCRSGPAEGSSFSLMIEGVPEGEVGLYPDSITVDAPAYMLGWTVGKYHYLALSETSNGTEVGVYYREGEEQDAISGTQYLRDVFDWYEQRFGEYGFGQKVASVSVDWGDAAFGGMEHHPYWHVASGSLSDPIVHAHEAAHGWFGNGVRIGCWEDFVLSEGMASYLAARSLEEVAGEEIGNLVWNSYDSQLVSLENSNQNKIAWPRGCNQIDILEDGLFGIAPYMKGALFFKQLEFVLGTKLFDSLLRNFYHTNRGRAVTLQTLLTFIEEGSDYAPAQCAQAWLRSEVLPQDEVCVY
ncbi:MAG: M1 family aminopeptidase [Candidatus Thiodiazotropha sp.]